ncbi:hypothetical protein [Nocardioides speluncae]|uniref:hypothetical protein n=1 Tax=Nocardioides speluncae TaxID=2670337 RepID=UPI000D6A0011|nr:hypothetical protein [Nocardioides speluncae]
MTSLLLLATAAIGVVAWKYIASNDSRLFWSLAAGNVSLVTLATVIAVSDRTLIPAPVEADVGATILAAAFGGGIVARASLKLAERGGLDPGWITLPASPWIGVSERLTIVIALLLRLPEVASVVVAVKALGQYADSQGSDGTVNHVLASRILGTMASLAWTLACYATIVVAGR